MRWPPESWPWLGSLALFLVLVFTFIASAYLIVIAALALHLVDFSSGTFAPQALVVIQLVTYVPIIAVSLVGLPIVSRLPLREIGFRIPNARDISIGLTGAVIMFAVVFALGFVVSLTGAKSGEGSVELFKQLTSARDRTLFISVACVFAPIAEEMFFRAFLFSALRRYTPTAAAAVLSAIAFGLLHMEPKSTADIVPQLLAVALPLVGGGIVLAYVFVTSGCYWSNVICHASFNAASVIGILVFHAT